MTRNCRDSFPTPGARGATDGHVERRLLLRSGGVIALIRTAGYPPCLQFAEGVKGGSWGAVDVDAEELQMIAMMLSEAG